MTRFVDQAVILVQAGRGGKGCHSFYRDLWTRHPIPDGGDGGRGGSVKIHSEPQLTTLLDFHAQRRFQAQSGGNASSKKKHGKQGADCLIAVPVGTLVYEENSGELIRDLARPGEEVLVARGGAGGIGNSHSRGQPSFRMESMEGAAGERQRLRLVLKLVADVGIIGMPNAGKSTLIGKISEAHPRVAAFPFTTTSPVLGAVTLPSEHRIVAVDVPGLIEGAHRGRGLGLDFLRHIERTRLLVHLIDMAGTDNRDPLEDHATLQAELKAYSAAVANIPQILVANKMDCPAAKKNLVRFKKKYKKLSPMPISAMTGEGVAKLLKKISDQIKKLKKDDG